MEPYLHIIETLVEEFFCVIHGSLEKILSSSCYTGQIGQEIGIDFFKGEYIYTTDIRGMIDGREVLDADYAIARFNEIERGIYRITVDSYITQWFYNEEDPRKTYKYWASLSNYGLSELERNIHHDIQADSSFFEEIGVISYSISAIFDKIHLRKDLEETYGILSKIEEEAHGLRITLTVYFS